jgi:hypothetical protein
LAQVFGKRDSEPHITIDKYGDSGIDPTKLNSSAYERILEEVGSTQLYAVGVGLFAAGTPKPQVEDFIGGAPKGMRKYYYYHDITRASVHSFPRPTPTPSSARSTAVADLAIMLSGPSAEALCRLGGDVWQGFLHITLAHGVPVNQILAKRDAWTAGLQRMFPEPTRLAFHIESRFLRLGRDGVSKKGNGMVGCMCINTPPAKKTVDSTDFESALAELDGGMKLMSLSDDSTDAASTVSSGGSDNGSEPGPWKKDKQAGAAGAGWSCVQQKPKQKPMHKPRQKQPQPSKCRNGPNCPHLKRGKCFFLHD